MIRRATAAVDEEEASRDNIMIMVIYKIFFVVEGKFYEAKVGQQENVSDRLIY
jgi:hypothetical protein